MAAPGGGALEALLHTITTWPGGMPVRPMERVLAAGAVAVPALTEGLAHWQDDEARDTLWLLVLLGEIREPAAVPALTDALRRAADEQRRHAEDELAVLEEALIATEALAKIGPPAVPALLETARAADPVCRIYAYAGLGWIPDDRGYAALLAALERDRPLGDAVAAALREHGRPDAIPALDAAYRAAAPWQRPHFEDALRALHWSRRPAPRWARDWRLRYRLPLSRRSFLHSWVWTTVRVDRAAAREATTPPPRPLQEILQAPPAPDEPADTCAECGRPLQPGPTGVPGEPEAAADTAAYQLQFLTEVREDGLEDLFDVLDEVTALELDHLQREEPPRWRISRQRWEDELEELQICRETCEWCIEQGAETVREARALLMVNMRELTARQDGRAPRGQPALPGGRDHRRRAARRST